MMDKRWRGFMAGVLSVSAIRSLVQDAIGREDYIRAVPLMWVEWYISVPIAVVLLLAAMIVMAPDIDKKKDGRE